MKSNFIKMHGLGNDYIFFDLFKTKFPEDKIEELTINLSDRNFGIGGDGVVLIKKPAIKTYDAHMRIFNYDGSEAEMCGNAIRCVAKHLFSTHFKNKRKLQIETLAGIIQAEKKNRNIKIDLGEARVELIKHKLKVENSDVFEITTVNIGNPHCVIFVDDVENFPVAQIGSAIEGMTAVFPKRTNVEFVEFVNQNELKMRVWERGVGETLACGTGAAATLVAAYANNLTATKAKIHLLGGDLDAEWDQTKNHVLQTGPAVKSFEGFIDLSDYL